MLSHGAMSPVKDSDPHERFCCICFWPYISTNTTTVPEAEEPIQLACGHTFGLACVESWVSANSNCPLCRCFTDISDISTPAHEWYDAVEYIRSSNRLDNSDTDSDLGDDLDGLLEFFDAHECLDDHQREINWVTTIRGRKRFHSLWQDADTSGIADLQLSFDDLAVCHAYWMAETLDESNDQEDDHVHFYDVFPY
jgi:hypothetical protein